jgi:DNA sulfur modification protein DndD
MTLDELVVHNFGVYGGRQSITLTPTSPDRPIVLFGGLNGGGKTTLLDALQLCLYGASARCSNRNSLSYEEYLRRSVHRGAKVPEAAVELAFRHTSNGAEQTFRIHRSWNAATSGRRETFEVLRNGDLDRLATENWAEQVEDFIPARIAHLFLFDGEKVESYADLDGAPALIATAIQNLLGLDIVERLTTDLGVLERRKRAEGKAPAQSGQVDDIRAKIERFDEQRQRLLRDQAAGANALDRSHTELAVLEDRYRREGGGLFEQRAELEGEAAASDRQLTSIQKELRDLAAGCAPMLLVRVLLTAARERDQAEQQVRLSRETAAAISDEHRALLALPELERLDASDRRNVAKALAARLAGHSEAGAKPTHLDLSPEGQQALSALVTSEIPATRSRLKAALASERKAAAAINHAHVALAAAPNYDAIAGIVASREHAQAEVVRLTSEQQLREAEISRLERELAQLREREAKLAEAEARERFADEDVRRLLLHSTKVRQTLRRFRDAVIERHVTRIERLVLESFHQLIRKRTLVSDLKIDPQTFSLELRGADGHLMTSERLSAGERQLLAIAILWGLAKASGRPLPTVIDTPLGRLDSRHRSHLVKRYFPEASHQVLLLSTDEEITGRYYEALKPSLGRTYHLRFDEGEGRTVVEPGYLDGDGHGA